MGESSGAYHFGIDEVGPVSAAEQSERCGSEPRERGENILDVETGAHGKSVGENEFNQREVFMASRRSGTSVFAMLEKASSFGCTPSIDHSQSP